MNSLENVIKRVFRADNLPAEATMADVEAWDSLTHMDLVADIESNFDITLTGDEIAGMQSVGAIRQVLQARGVA
jgi:acyl carrier protein